MHDQTHKNSLTKVIVNKSHLDDRLVEIKTYGHTLFTGPNAGGKSTTLSLYGAFFGAEPSKLVDREAGKKPFDQLYLGSEKSFIAYEYIKAGELKMAFIYRNGNGIAYRLASISSEMLLSQANIGALDNDYSSTREWLAQHISKQVHVTPQINTTAAYRAVIQNNRAELGKRRMSDSKLLSIAQSYSLCNPDFSMQHIDVLVSTMMRNNQMLENFKRMISDSFIAPKVSISNSPFDKRDIQHLDSLKAICELEGHRPVFDNAIMLSKHIKDLYEQGAILLSQINCRVENDLQNKALSNAELLSEVESHEKCEDEVDGKIRELKRSLGEAEVSLSITIKELDRIHAKRLEFEDDKDIHSLIGELEQAEEVATQLKGASEHLVRLRSGLEQKEEQLNAQLSELDKKHFELESDINRKISSHQTALGLINKEFSDAIEAEQNTCRQALLDTSSSFRVSIDSKRNELTEAKLDAERASHFTQEQNAELTTYRDQIEDARVESESSNGEAAECYRRINKVRVTRQGLVDDLHVSTSQKKKFEEEVARLNELIDPQKGSLCEFLSHEADGWENTFGKFINPSLLSRTDLKPYFCEYDQSISDSEILSNSMFGLVLDLANVESEYGAEKERRLSDYHITMGKLSDASKAERALSEQVKSLDKDLNALQSDLLLAERRSKKSSEEADRIRLLLDKKHGEFEEQAVARSITASEKIAVLSLEVSGLENSCDQKLRDTATASKQVIMEFRANATLKVDQGESSISNLRKAILTHKKTTRTQQDQLKKQHTARLKSEGIDTEVISLARQAVDSLTVRSEAIERSRPMVAEYRSWISTDWERVTGLTIDEKNQAAEVAEAKTGYENYISTSKSELSGRLAKIKTLRASIKKLGDDAGALEGYSKKIGELLPPEHLKASEHGSALDVDFAKEKAAEFISDVNQSQSSIVGSIDTVTNVLGSLAGKNDISDFWESMKQQRWAELSRDNPDMTRGSEFKIALLPSLDRLLNYVIPEQKSIVLEVMRTVAQKYVNFYLTLDDINKKIKSVSNELERSIETSNPFPAIDAVKLGLSSKITTFDSWSDLVTFEKEWDRWSESGVSTVPDRSFINAFDAVYESLSMMKMTRDLSSLVELEIVITENGTARTIRRDADLANVGSEGVSKLAIIAVFCGMVRYLCPDEQTLIHWPVDELGKISLANTGLLFKMMTDKSISLVTAQPDPRREMLKHYENKLHIDKSRGVMTYVVARQERASSKLFSVLESDVTGEKG